MALIKKNGYGQVEPNHLSAQRNGQIYAQLPANKDIAVLENGMFVKYNYAAGECNFTGDGEFMLVMNEVKIYDPKRQSYKDFALKVEDFVDGKLYPRVFKTMPGDLFTTNTFAADGVELVLGDKLVVGAEGYLVKGAAVAGQPLFQVVKVYTLADGQPAVKVQRIA